MSDNLFLTAPKSIIKAISKLPFPHSIQNRACIIYSRLNIVAIPRKENRDKILCYCIHQAYIEGDMGIIDPCLIGGKFGMTTTKSNSAINNRPKYKDGYKPVSPTATPIKMMIGYAREALYLPAEIVSGMITVFEAAISTNKDLLSQQIKPLIAAFIMCYLENNGLVVNKDELSELFFLKYSTIRPKFNKVQLAIASV